MPIRYAWYATCDRCGDVLADGPPDSALFDSAHAARTAAQARGWRQASDELLCGELCAELMEADAERAVAASPVRHQARVERGDVDRMLPHFLREVYGEADAENVAQAEAWGALVYRVAGRLELGADFKDIFDQLDTDDVRFAPTAVDPAAFLAARINQLNCK